MRMLCHNRKFTDSRVRFWYTSSWPSLYGLTLYPPPPFPDCYTLHIIIWFCVPPHFETAIVKPLLKNTHDKNVLKNYSPISYLPFPSKILEMVVLHKLLAHFQ